MSGLKLGRYQDIELKFDPNVVKQFFSDDVITLSNAEINKRFSKQTIKELQSFLLEVSNELGLGISLGDFGEEKDGVDGIWGRLTRAAVEVIIETQGLVWIQTQLFTRLDNSSAFPGSTGNNNELAEQKRARNAALEATIVNNPDVELTVLEKVVDESLYDATTIERISTRNVVTGRSILLLEKTHIDYAALYGALEKADLSDQVDVRVKSTTEAMKEDGLYEKRKAQYREYFEAQGMSEEDAQREASNLLEKEIEIEVLHTLYEEDAVFQTTIQKNDELKNLYKNYKESYTKYIRVYDTSYEYDGDVSLSPIANALIYQDLLKKEDLRFTPLGFTPELVSGNLEGMTGEQLKDYAKTLSTFQEIDPLKDGTVDSMSEDALKDYIIKSEEMLSEALLSTTKQVETSIYGGQLAYVEMLFGNGSQVGSSMDMEAMKYSSDALSIGPGSTSNSIEYHGVQLEYIIQCDTLVLSQPNDPVPYKIPIPSSQDLLGSISNIEWNVETLQKGKNIKDTVLKVVNYKIFAVLEESMASKGFEKRNDFLERTNLTSLYDAILTVSDYKTTDGQARGFTGIDQSTLLLDATRSLDVRNRSPSFLQNLLKFFTHPGLASISESLDSSTSMIDFLYSTGILEALGESTISEEQLNGLFFKLKNLFFSPDTSTLETESKTLKEYGKKLGVSFDDWSWNVSEGGLHISKDYNLGSTIPLLS